MTEVTHKINGWVYCIYIVVKKNLIGFCTENYYGSYIKDNKNLDGKLSERKVIENSDKIWKSGVPQESVLAQLMFFFIDI